MALLRDRGCIFRLGSLNDQFKSLYHFIRKRCHWIKARTHARVEICHYRTRCLARGRKHEAVGWCMTFFSFGLSFHLLFIILSNFIAIFVYRGSLRHYSRCLIQRRLFSTWRVSAEHEYSILVALLLPKLVYSFTRQSLLESVWNATLHRWETQDLCFHEVRDGSSSAHSSIQLPYLSHRYFACDQRV